MCIHVFDSKRWFSKPYSTWFPLQTERGTDADDGGAFERANIPPNVLREDDVIKHNIHRENKEVIKGKLVPIRPKKVIYCWHWTANLNCFHRSQLFQIFFLSSQMMCWVS